MLEVISSLKHLNPFPAILCVNEVNLLDRPDVLDQLSIELGKVAAAQVKNSDVLESKPYEVSFFGHVNGTYGNAVLINPCVAAVRRTESHHLPGGTKIRLNSGSKKISGEVLEKETVHRIVRGMIELEIELKLAPQGPENADLLSNARTTKVIKVACTHLDHIKEAERETQLDYIARTVFGPEDGHGALLLGDLNAMKRSDYSEAEWRKLEDHHTEMSWSPPSFGALSKLESSGWVDCFETSFVQQSRELREMPNVEKCTAHVGDPMYRIDHVFANTAYLQAFKVVNAFVFTKCTASDHFPVCIDFKLR